MRRFTTFCLTIGLGMVALSSCRCGGGVIVGGACVQDADCESGECRTDKTCGTAIVIQAYGINRPLPLNKPVTVEFTPDKAGEFTFACGMGMLRGKIIVE